HGPAVGTAQAADHLDGGRLPGAVGPEDGEYLPFLHGEGDPLDDGAVSVPLGQSAYFDDCHAPSVRERQPRPHPPISHPRLASRWFFVTKTSHLPQRWSQKPRHSGRAVSNRRRGAAGGKAEPGVVRRAASGSGEARARRRCLAPRPSLPTPSACRSVPPT